MDKQNIALVESSTGFGGSAKCVYQFANLLSTEKYNIHLFIRKKIGWYENQFKKEIMSINCINYNPEKIIYCKKISQKLSYLSKALQVVSMLPYCVLYLYYFNKFNITLVHLNNNIYAHLPVIIASRILNIPIICHLHDQNQLTLIERYFVTFIKRFFILSSSALDTYSKHICKEKLVIIENGIITSDFKRKKSDGRCFIQIRSPAVGVVGRLIQWKGQETLIKAAPYVLRSIKNANFYIVGDDPAGNKEYKNYLINLSRELGCEEKVVFTGWCDDIMPIMKKLDVCICTSIEPEPFGLVILESMFAETPIISTRNGGPLDIIEDEKDGLFYDPGDYLELAQKIIRILIDNEFAKKITAAAKMKVLKNYSIEKIIKKIEYEYDRIL